MADDQIIRVKRMAIKLSCQLNPPISKAELEAYEKLHNCRLPDDYRNFLLFIGNGGEGPPDYGISRLGEVPGAMERSKKRFWIDLPRVLEPFPFTKPWIWEDGDISVEGTEDQTHCGSIRIGDDGCGLYWHVIITGPERGNMWMFSGVGIAPALPKMTFLQWYEDWLTTRVTKESRTK